MKKSTLFFLMTILSLSASAQIKYWSLAGNAFTKPAINFIGTTDSTPVRFRANNTWAGEINQFTHNTSFGYVALSEINPKKGPVSGLNNSAFGGWALRANQKGSANTAVGFQALESLSSGDNNTAVGINSLVYMSSGTNNTAIGASSLYSAKSVVGNTAVGVNSLFNNSTGDSNVAIGAFALDLDSNGSKNTAVGFQSLLNNSTGTNNTSLGFRSLAYNKTGTFITTIGNNADVVKDGMTNATAIGNGAKVDANDKVVIGNNAVKIIGGFAPWSNFSDERFKYNIRNNVPGLAFIKRLKTITYQVDVNKLNMFMQTGVLQNNDAHNASFDSRSQWHTGPLAQQVENICKEIGYDFDGVITPAGKNGTYSLAYSQFVVPLIQAVQEQQNIIEKLENENTGLKQSLKEILLRLEKLEQKR